MKTGYLKVTCLIFFVLILMAMIYSWSYHKTLETYQSNSNSLSSSVTNTDTNINTDNYTGDIATDINDSDSSSNNLTTDNNNIENDSCNNNHSSYVADDDSSDKSLVGKTVTLNVEVPMPINKDYCDEMFRYLGKKNYDALSMMEFRGEIISIPAGSQITVYDTVGFKYKCKTMLGETFVCPMDTLKKVTR